MNNENAPIKTLLQRWIMFLPREEITNGIFGRTVSRVQKRGKD